jgi:hypothetical protein
LLAKGTVPAIYEKRTGRNAAGGNLFVAQLSAEETIVTEIIPAYRNLYCFHRHSLYEVKQLEKGPGA